MASSRKRRTARKAKLQQVAIQSPMDSAQPPMSFRLHLDLHLTREQSHALRMLTAGLEQSGAQIDCGAGKTGGVRNVSGYNAAIRWLLAQLHASLQAADPKDSTDSGEASIS